MKKSSVMLCILFIVLISSTIAFADSSQYAISNVMKDIDVQDDATTVISEDITYDIYSQINGVYRIIPLSGGQSVSDISVETPGYYNTVEIINSSNNITIKVWLYNDEAKTQKINPGKVEVIYHYKYNKALKVYNDIAELQYMSWGDEWDVPVDLLTTRIHLPGDINNCQYWNNPEMVVKSSKIEDNTLITEYNRWDANKNVEQRIIMPKEYIKDTSNADVINKDARDIILNQQKDYAFWQNVKNNVGYIVVILSTLLILGQLVIYMRYGRDTKSSYAGLIQSEIPTDHSPLFVNAMFNSAVGQIDTNAYNAVLLDLINRKYYKLISSTADDTIIKCTDKNADDLKQYEWDVYDYVNRFMDDKSHISFKNMESSNQSFAGFIEAWHIDIRSELSEFEVKKYYNEKGHDYSAYLALFSLIITGISIVMLLFDLGGYASSSYGLVASLVLGIVSIIVISLPSDIMGKWTKEGQDFHDQWSNFKKYLTDYSLIKDYPPASVQLWGKYLVYATALGCAKQVSSNMKKLFDETNISTDLIDNDVLMLSYMGYYHFYMPHHIASVDSSSGLMGSFGDIGGPGSGGFGGGGGGVF